MSSARPPGAVGERFRLRPHAFTGTLFVRLGVDAADGLFDTEPARATSASPSALADALVNGVLSAES